MMNKQKFEVKCQALYKYEDEMYERIKEIVRPYNDELSKLNYEIVVMLYWTYPGDNKFNEIGRIPIEKKKEYHCLVSLQFQNKGSNCFEEGQGFQLVDEVTCYGLSLWKGWVLEKRKCKSLFNNLDYYFRKVKEEGLERVSKEVAGGKI